MPNLFDIRYNSEKRHHELLVSYDNQGNEDWVPAATYWAYHRIPFVSQWLSSYTLYDLLLMEGWTLPKIGSEPLA